MNTHLYAFEYLLGELVRRGCERALLSAVEEEIEEWLSGYGHLRDSQGRQRIVRNGYLPERGVRSSVGVLKISVPRNRDRKSGEPGERIQFNSQIVPPYLRRLPGNDGQLTWLWLGCMVSGDQTNVVSDLLGRRSGVLSPAIIARLKQIWRSQWVHWRTRNLSGRDYQRVVVGVVRNQNLARESDCFVVAVGITNSGTIDLLNVVYGSDSCEQLWNDVLFDLRRRGLDCSLSALTAGTGVESGKATLSSSNAELLQFVDASQPFRVTGLS